MTIERGILFSAPMVRALIEGRKTQTRRLATSPLARMREGDRLWVRETWKPHSAFADMKPRDVPPSNVFYQADDRYAPSNTPWVPSIFMPRWASRLTLTVEAVRVEPLRDISEADALAEGVKPMKHSVGVSGNMVQVAQGYQAREAYACLWNSLHTRAGERWDDNPLVVALTFRVDRKPVFPAL